jgi:4-hydroxy-3-methylbut-2-enyl diphosphate reductase IspH
VSNRQNALKVIAGRSDLVLIVAGANSRNCQSMVTVALAAGAGAAWLIQSADELRAEWLAGMSTIGVSSGASTPEVLVQEGLASQACGASAATGEHAAVPSRLRAGPVLGATVRCVPDVPPRASCYRVRIRHTLHA